MTAVQFVGKCDVLRHRKILHHFLAALGVDDFMARYDFAVVDQILYQLLKLSSVHSHSLQCRVEVVLSGYGFTGDNSIAMTNLCRDEVNPSSYRGILIQSSSKIRRRQ